VKTVLKITFALAAAWLVSGCSALRVAYENADVYLRWRAGEYLDVHGDAAEELDDRIDSFLAWHRAHALPKYARLAEDAAGRMARALSPADLVWGYDAAIAQSRESLRAAAERIAPMLDRLTPEQVARMEKRFAEDNRKFARENLRGSQAERQKRRARRNVERLEDWVGRLSKAQVERVRQYSERAPALEEMRDRERKRLQAELLAMVRAREAQKRLPERAAHWDEGRDPAYSAGVEAWRREFSAMVLDLDRSLSREQRARAVANLRRYAEDFSVLARRQ
jgi:Family of unknown function (DUF6279)